jgi:hypothetical protein
MSPKKTKVIGKYTIEEYYWAGKSVVYVNNRLQDFFTFDMAVSHYKELNNAK